MTPFNPTSVHGLVNPKIIAANLTSDEAVDAACISKAMPPPSINLEQYTVNYFNITDKTIFPALLTPSHTILTISDAGTPLLYSLPTTCVPMDMTADETPPKTFILAQTGTSATTFYPVKLKWSEVFGNVFTYVWNDPAKSPLFKSRVISQCSAADWNNDIEGSTTPGGTDLVELPARPDDDDDMPGLVGYVTLAPRSFILPGGIATYDNWTEAELLAVCDDIHPDLRYWYLGLKWSVVHLAGRGLDHSDFLYHPPNRISERYAQRPNKRSFEYLHKHVCIPPGNPDHTSGPVQDLKARFVKAQEDSLMHWINKHPKRVKEIMAMYAPRALPPLPTGTSPPADSSTIRIVDPRTERELTQKKQLFDRHKTTYQLIGCKVIQRPGGNFGLELGNPSSPLCDCWETDALPMDQQIRALQQFYTSYANRTSSSMNVIVMTANKDEERMTREMTAALKNAMFATGSWTKAADNKNKIFIGVFVPLDQQSAEYKTMVEKNKVRAREAQMADNGQASRKANEGLNLYVQKDFLDHTDLLKTLATFLFDLGFWLDNTTNDDIPMDSLLAADLINIFKRVNTNNVTQWFRTNLPQYPWIGHQLLVMVHNVIATFMKWATNPDTIQDVQDNKALDYDQLAGYKMTISRVTAALEGIEATGSVDGFTTQPSTWYTKEAKVSGNKRKNDQVDVDLTSGGTPGQTRPPPAPLNQQQRQQQQQQPGGRPRNQERRNSNGSQRTPSPFTTSTQGDLYNSNGRSFLNMPQRPLASGKKPCIKWHDVTKFCDKSPDECEYDHTPYCQLIDGDKDIFDEFLNNNEGVYLRQQRSVVRQPHFGGVTQRAISPRTLPTQNNNNPRTTRSRGSSTDETASRSTTG